MQKEDKLISVRYIDVCRRAGKEQIIDDAALITAFENEMKQHVAQARAAFINNLDVCRYYAQEEQRNNRLTEELHRQAGK